MERFFSSLLSFLLFILGAKAADQPVFAPRVIVLKQHIPSRADGGVRFNYLSFHVPPDVSRVDFWNDYDPAGGKNVVDMGLFDSTAKDVKNSLEGYRGKSPRSRDAAFLTARSASYGYIPGPLPAGDWRIYLDAYKVQPQGVDVTVNVVLTVKSNTTPETPAAWLRGDLHMHTLHSDGALTIPALAAMAHHNGLDFVCITDHNVSSQDAEINLLNQDRFFSILRGEEVTTDGGHFNACGLPTGSLLEFRINRGDQARLSQVTDEGHRLGALLTANHPFASCQACDWSFDKSMPGLDAVEVWNGSWDPSDEKALRLWDSQLKSGRRITALADSDTHQDTPGYPTTVVRAPSTRQADLLAGIRAGRVYLEQNPHAGNLSFQALDATQAFQIGDTIPLSGPADLQFHATFSSSTLHEAVTLSLLTADGLAASQRFTNDIDFQKILHFHRNNYVRVEIRDLNGKMIAMSNPIFVTMSSGH